MSTIGFLCCENRAAPGEKYRRCGEPVPPEVMATGAMGCKAYCLPCFLAYHRAASVEEVAERVRAAAAVKYQCARCRRPARWIAGAGEALCERHEDDY
jgi:hypothetical protein